MGFFDRIGKVAAGAGGLVSGVWGGTREAVGLLGDIATAEWRNEEEFDGFLNWARVNTEERFVQGFTRAFGPEEGLGVIGRAAPEAVRAPIREVFEGAHWAYKNGIAEPAATAAILSNQVAEGEAGTVASRFGDLLTNPARVREAYDLAQAVTPGQAVAVSLFQKNIMDPDEMAELVGTDAFNVASGSIDALINWFGDPTVIGGKAAAAARVKYLVRPVRSTDQIDNFFAGGSRARKATGHSWDEIDGWIASTVDEADSIHQAAGRIRQRMFANDPHGDMKAHMLAVAPDAAARESSMRFLMGDQRELAKLNRYEEELAERIGDLQKAQRAPDEALQAEYARAATVHGEALRLAEDMTLVNRHPEGFVRDLAKFRIRNSPERLDSLKGQVAFAGVEQQTINRLRTVFKSQLDAEPRLTRLGGIRDAVAHSSWFQQPGGFGRAVQHVAHMKPQRLVELENAGQVTEHMARMLREARLATDDLDEWVGRLGAAASPGERLQVWQQAENAAFRQIADEFGMHPADVSTVLERAQKGRAAARQVMHDPHSRAYASGGRDWIRFEDEVDGTIHEVPMPMAVTQTANRATTVDFVQVRNTLKELQDSGRLRKVAGKPARMTREALETVSFYWKAGVLLRPAWTARVVLMDEQLRMIAKFGAMTALKDLPQRTRNLGVSLMKDLGWDKAAATKRGAVFGGATGFIAGGPAGAALGALAGGGVARKLAALDQVGYGSHVTGAFRFDGPFGAPDDAANVYRGLVSQSRDMKQFLGPEEQGILERFRTDSTNWGTVAPQAPNYAGAWENAVNLQIAQDGLWRQALRGIAEGEDAATTATRMREWLDTPEGLAYLEEIPWRKSETASIRRAGGWTNQTPERWVSSLYDEAVRLVSGDADLAAAALQKKAAHADLAKLKPNVIDRPEVHGQVLAQMSGQSEIVKTVNGFIERWYRRFGGLPTDDLARNPTFAMFYRNRLDELADGIDATYLTTDQLKAWERQARISALDDTRNLLYDLAERSQFGEMVRFAQPFFDAYWEVFSRWTGLAVENPAFVARATMAWEAVNKIPGAVWTDPDSGDEYLQFRIPQWAETLVDASPFFRDAIDAGDMVTIPKDALKNVPVLGGPESLVESVSMTFGFGPFVQLAVSELVTQRPTLEESVQFVLPYGVSDDWIDSFLPAWGRRARSLFKKEDDRAYASAYRSNLRTHLVKMNQGLEPRVDMTDETARSEFLAQVKEETDALFKFRTFVNFVAPAAPTFRSPYEPWIREYRRMQSEGTTEVDVGGQTMELSPDERFWMAYGEELFPLTQSLTKVNNGVPSTIEGFEAQEANRELIEKYPELGGLIVGTEAGGHAARFSTAMYARQQETPIREGSKVMEREPYSPEEFVTNPDVKMGWLKYSRVMDLITSERVRRGLPNLGVNEARDLRQTKRAVIARLEAEHPAWAESRNQFDENKWQKKIEGMRAIVADPDKAGRPDLAGLSRYLQLRDAMLDRLQARAAGGGKKTLSAKSNQDLAMQWDAVTERLVEENPAFAELFYRWLERDPMTLDTRSTTDQEEAA